jgi:chloride channel protein, CIC family
VSSRVRLVSGTGIVDERLSPVSLFTRTSWRATTTRASRWLSSTSYLQKWLVLGVLIGMMAGVGAIVFYEALVACTHFFLGMLAGYHVPTPASEGGQAASASFSRPWALPLVVGLGALLGAILVYRFAPEAEGHGTDAAISAVHHNPRGIRFRAVVVKIIASALTIGSGGSGGREGPTGQISAGFASLLARELDLSAADARIAVVTGIGSGIGAIFGAPLGGAVLATEILYRDDFDAEALLPSFIASLVGYVIFGAAVGYKPLFGFNQSYHFTNPTHLIWFGLIGILGGLIGLLYAKGFYGIAEGFTRVPLPRWMKPAIGGVIVGCIALLIPEVLGTGYGWIQQSLGHQLLTLPLWIVLVLPFARIGATGLSIGSGGSGGIFGPGMVIGAFIGASVWRLFEPIVPSIGHNPAPYVIVGMMCCFGGISRAPLAVMLMVAEMTGNLSILAPAMVAVGLSWFIVRRSDDTIYRSQLKNRAAAPAQRLLTGMPVLANVSVLQAMAPPRVVITGGTSLTAARQKIQRAGVSSAPVVDDEARFEGTIALDELQGIESRSDRRLGSLVDVSAPTVSSSSNLDVAVDAMASASQHWVPVLDTERKVIGTIATSDVVRGYRLGLLASLQKVNAEDDPGGTDRVRIESGSPLVGLTLRQARLPLSIIVTTILRKQDLVVPNGGTVLEVGDELVVIGQSSDIDLILKTTADRSAHGDGHGCIREGQGEGSPGSVIPGTKEG